MCLLNSCVSLWVVREGEDYDDTILFKKNFGSPSKFRSPIDEAKGDAPKPTYNFFENEACPGLQVVVA